ncbi:MAG: discoidin domain-containing protein, partial [Planctomycetota bacterium]
MAGNVANADLIDGLLAWHDFEDLVDSSGNDHNAVLFGDAYLSDGLLWLDGDEDYADIGTLEGFGGVNPLIDAQGDFTIAIAYASDNTDTGEDGSLLVSVGPDDAGGSGDLSLVTNDDGQAIDHWYVDGFQSEQSGVGYANGTVHLVLLTYEEATAAYTFYHIDAGGNAVSHGGEEGFDWSGGWDEGLDYGIRLGSHRNVVIREDEGPGFFPDLDGQIDMFAIWNRALDVSEMPLIAEYGPSKEKAGDPSPPDEAEDVALDAVLAWAPGNSAQKHDVYFGTDFDDVNEATTSDPRGVYQNRQDDSRYPAAGTLDVEYGVTYYWRIDEANSPPDLTVFRGDVWRFTAEPFAYPIAAENIVATASGSDPDTAPENTVNGSGLEDGLHSQEKGDMWLSAEDGPQPTWIQYEFDKVYKLHEMWVWNYNESWEAVLGVGFKDVTVEYSTDGAEYATLDAATEFAQAPGASDYEHNTTIPFGGAVAKYVRITANSNFKGMLVQYGLSEVCFLYKPIRAREPEPASGAEEVGPEVVLGWRAGREAASHDVYLASDEDAVADGTASVVTVPEPGYDVGTLDLATTYYWRVDEVNEAETPRTLEGDVWHFTTPEFLVVDDFESYDDEENAIFDAWVDGWANDTGSTVGYFEAPFTEEEIVNSGGQSMPLYYDNTAGVTLSEATRAFGPAQDWTAAGVKALTLYVHGSED